MGASVHDLKHAAKLQEWSAKVAECRSSGNGVKAWCAEHGISPKTYYSWERQIVKEATEKYAMPAPGQSNLLVQVNPDAMPGNDTGAAWSAITIRHGESAITLPAGSAAGFTRISIPGWLVMGISACPLAFATTCLSQ